MTLVVVSYLHTHTNSYTQRDNTNIQHGQTETEREIINMYKMKYMKFRVF